MLPIYIICHADCEPSGYLCTYFEQRNILYKKFHAIKNDLTTLDLDCASGLVFMGGPYSVNDEHPWVAEEIKLIQIAIEKKILLMGVCLGSQLISKALGAEIHHSTQMELGWYPIMTDTSKLSHLPPLKLDKSFTVFEWHEDEFSVPEGAIPIFTGHHLENQGYLFGERILAMQFHMEMAEHMVHDWLECYSDCLPIPSESVQSPEQVTENLPARLEDLHRQADIIYDWWLSLGKLNS